MNSLLAAIGLAGATVSLALEANARQGSAKKIHLIASAFILIALAFFSLDMLLRYSVHNTPPLFLPDQILQGIGLLLLVNSRIVWRAAVDHRMTIISIAFTILWEALALAIPRYPQYIPNMPSFSIAWPARLFLCWALACVQTIAIAEFVDRWPSSHRHDGRDEKKSAKQYPLYSLTLISVSIALIMVIASSLTSASAYSINALTAITGLWLFSLILLITTNRNLPIGWLRFAIWLPGALFFWESLKFMFIDGLLRWREK